MLGLPFASKRIGEGIVTVETDKNTTAQVEVNGVRYNYKTGGKPGAPWITFAHALAETAAQIPGAQHAVIPDAGHISVLENPLAVQAVLEDFLAGL